MAEEIGRDDTDLRLPEAGIPREVLPLVRAVNDALDRLDAGFRAQRELPLTRPMSCARRWRSYGRKSSTLDDREVAAPLRHDVENMSRLVNQLLEISELRRPSSSPMRTISRTSLWSRPKVAAFLAPLAC